MKLNCEERGKSSKACHEKWFVRNPDDCKCPKCDTGHGEIIYGDTSWIEDDCPDTFSEFIFPFPPAAAPCDDFSLVDSVET